MECHSLIDAARQAAILGIGIARLPGFVAEPDVKTGRLVRLLEEKAQDPLVLHALYPSHRQNSLKIRKFIDLLLAHLEASAT